MNNIKSWYIDLDAEDFTQQEVRDMAVEVQGLLDLAVDMGANAYEGCSPKSSRHLYPYVMKDHELYTFFGVNLEGNTLFSNDRDDFGESISFKDIIGYLKDLRK